MNPAREIPAATLAAQHRASDPAVSAWVSANAGSGKTHVLAQRVVRLLLSGTPPGRILCLTFTKAAAANMAARVFGTLANWTRLDDAALVAAIEATGSARPRPDQLVFARRLFARTLETPGGLKIQTIHAFCERLLHLFPFEANVAAGFEVIEDQRQAELMAQARNATLDAAIRGEDGLGPPLQALAGETSADGFELVLQEALRNRADLAARELELPGAALAALLGLPPGQTAAGISHSMLHDGIAPTRWAGLAQWFAGGRATDQKQATQLTTALALLQAGDSEAALDGYLNVFFTREMQPRQRLATADLVKKSPKVLPLLIAESVRLEACLESRRAAAVAERSAALVQLASAVFQRYEQLKAGRGLIDFEDLIQRTQALFSRSEAAWVLYKLDSGIDHILLDEAQDTSPAQWEILKALATDFTAGAGQRPMQRSLFAVGDEKQSIYSFQGAEPQNFAAMRRYFGQRVRAAGHEFAELDLTLSFRSAPEILEAVDHVFRSPENHAGLSGDGAHSHTVHGALKTDLRGHVEIWPPVMASEADAPPGWKMPLDAEDSSAPASRLARRIAGTIRAMVAPGSPQRVRDKDGAARPVVASDVMILVRSRNSFFDAVIRALKEQEVPVAGADRLALTDHIAVMDLIAAGRTALLPQDDLTLANALKSPLIGLTDDDLTEIAPGRPGSLLEALEAARAERFQIAARHLAVWRERAQGLTPFGFYSRLLGADGGRLALTERLGLEARDAIDEFLNLALAHERTEAPSLATFLAGLEAAELTVKRDMEAAGAAVRVMTVHAAKGLEAKIVFLPDTCADPGPPREPAVLALKPGQAAGNSGAKILVWSPRKGEDPNLVGQAREEVHRLAVEENRRLLYVAMTRAEERLYISGFCGSRGPAEGCWHSMIQTALVSHLKSAPAPWDGQETIWRSGMGLLAGDALALAEGNIPSVLMPAWLGRNAAAEAAVLPPLRPSHALEAADRVEAASSGASLVRQSARAAGRHQHVLMQYLPALHPVQRLLAGESYLAAQTDLPDAGERRAVLANVLKVLEYPGLAALFGEGSIAEVGLAGHIMRQNGSRIEISGQIDRLAVLDEEVLIADFKTGRPRSLAETPFGIVTQLALYRRLACGIYPGKKVRALLIWTQGPLVVELDDARLDAAVELVRMA